MVINNLNIYKSISLSINLIKASKMVGEGSGCINESFDGQYTCNCLTTWETEKKEFKNKDNQWFHWCYIRHLNLMKKKRQIQNPDHKMVEKLDYKSINFPVS